MERKSLNGLNCDIARSLDEVGEWWSLLIVRQCMIGTTRFDEFQRNLGISRNVLTTRLDRLVSLGILERFQLQDRANTSGYRLTAKGWGLDSVLNALLDWGARWVAPDGRPRLEELDEASLEEMNEAAKRFWADLGLSDAVVDAANDSSLEAVIGVKQILKSG
ncbi:winged helix-turn-helix transcriptional regulator [Caenimonas soli]|uniref:winged helix-turn-helix transcriptional regulator n=1 Tax=Caenimonas soli TaxID=2735555 RepID=UPI001557B899|nr:helix-turn-helix domain-containing protein [Caenimonas soli]NPC59154.1 helix-turn-helix transcriptional regulator [Caenimonas soli]